MFKCPKCSLCAATQLRVSSHLYRKHNLITDHCYKCSLCDLSTTDRYDFLRHCICIKHAENLKSMLEQNKPEDEQIKPEDEQNKPEDEQNKPEDEQIKPEDVQIKPEDEQNKAEEAFLCSSSHTGPPQLEPSLPVISTVWHTTDKSLIPMGASEDGQVCECKECYEDPDMKLDTMGQSVDLQIIALGEAASKRTTEDDMENGTDSDGEGMPKVRLKRFTTCMKNRYLGPVLLSSGY